MRIVSNDQTKVGLTTFSNCSGKSLLSGKFPSEDQFGLPLLGSRAGKADTWIANGWRAAFESWTGDWKERSLSHQFVRRNYQSMRMCDQCDCIKPFAATPQNLLHLIYTNFSMSAPWTSTIRSHEQYLASTEAENLTPWLEVPGFKISRVKWDSAHVILLGTGKDLSASVMWDLVHGLNYITCVFIYFLCVLSSYIVFLFLPSTCKPAWCISAPN